MNKIFNQTIPPFVGVVFKFKIMKKILIIITILCSLNVFSQWVEVSLPINSDLNDVFFVDDNIGYLVSGGEGGYPNGTDGLILKTIDSGMSWNVVYTENNIAINYISYSQNILYAFGKNSDFLPIVLYSNNNGISWETNISTFQAEKIISYNNMIYFVDIMNNNSLTKFYNENNIETIIDDVSIFYISGFGIIKINDNGDNIKSSSDFGLNWVDLNEHPVEFGQNQLLYAEIKQIGNEVIIYGTYPEGILYTNDFGNNWEYNYVNVLPVTINTASVIYGITNIINEENKIITINYNSNSTNIQSAIGNNGVKKIYLYDDNLCFIIGENGMMYKTENGGGLSISENETLEKKIKVFPNPAKSIIKLEVLQEFLIKKIQLYTIQGKLVKSYKKTARELNICDIASGNYILKIKTDKGVVTKKIIIE